MVGPEIEKTGMVRHSSRLFLAGAALTVPMFTIVLRKAYGLGAMAMAGGSFHESFFSVSWPTGEFGAMGLEGAVKLGYKKEIESRDTPEQQAALYERLVKSAYEKGKALNAASTLEFDEVIDPIDTRKWILTGLDTIDPSSYLQGSGRYIDSW